MQLSVILVTFWISEFNSAHGRAPSCSDDDILAPDGSTWAAINTSMTKGGRGWNGKHQGLLAFIEENLDWLIRKTKRKSHKRSTVIKRSHPKPPEVKVNLKKAPPALLDYLIAEMLGMDVAWPQSVADVPAGMTAPDANSTSFTSATIATPAAPNPASANAATPSPGTLPTSSGAASGGTKVPGAAGSPVSTSPSISPRKPPPPFTSNRDLALGIVLDRKIDMANLPYPPVPSPAPGVQAVPTEGVDAAGVASALEVGTSTTAAVDHPANSTNQAVPGSPGVVSDVVAVDWPEDGMWVARHRGGPVLDQSPDYMITAMRAALLLHHQGQEEIVASERMAKALKEGHFAEPAPALVPTDPLAAAPDAGVAAADATTSSPELPKAIAVDAAPDGAEVPEPNQRVQQADQAKVDEHRGAQSVAPTGVGASTGAPVNGTSTVSAVPAIPAIPARSRSGSRRPSRAVNGVNSAKTGVGAGSGSVNEPGSAQPGAVDPSMAHPAVGSAAGSMQPVPIAQIPPLAMIATKPVEPFDQPKQPDLFTAPSLPPDRSPARSRAPAVSAAPAPAPVQPQDLRTIDFPDRPENRHLPYSMIRIQTLADTYTGMLGKVSPLADENVGRWSIKLLELADAQLKKRPAIQFWGQVFAAVARSDRLCGRAGEGAGAGADGIKVTLEWILRDADIEAILAGDRNNVPSTSSMAPMNAASKGQGSGIGIGVSAHRQTPVFRRPHPLS